MNLLKIWKSWNIGQKLILANLLVIFIMMIVYYGMNLSDPTSFRFTVDKEGPITLEDIVYFTIITHATVGYGDIVPAKRWSRVAVSIHVLFVLVANLAIVWISLNEEIKESVNKVTERVIEQSRQIMSMNMNPTNFRFKSTGTN